MKTNPSARSSLLNATLKIFKFALIFLLILFYVAYLRFLISLNHGPVDFDTFLDIGSRFLNHQSIYGVNSFYPMPFVGIFALFSWLPRPISLLIWFGGQVFISVLIGGFWTLAFPPTFAIQTSLPGMVGLWGFRRSKDKPIGGFWLALTFLKPQLGIFPGLWALNQWIKDWRLKKHFSRQGFICLLTSALIYIPWFIVYPNWVQVWLENPRNLRERAMAGILPRTLYYLNLPPIFFWSILLIIGIALFLYIKHRDMNLDHFVLLGFLVSPLVHDYDLLQLIPLVDTPMKRWVAVLFSIPLWIVIFFFYDTDLAWYTTVIITPAILSLSLYDSILIRFMPKLNSRID